MYYYHLHQWLFFFYFYCFFGWCFESTYVSIKAKKTINRGFMKGPWLPIYGSGAICVLFTTLPFHEHWYLVYLVGAISATILEYIVGASMVTIFKVRYWDYSNRKFQLHGHICLHSTIAWGGLSLLMVYVVHEPIATLVLKINDDILLGITHLLTALIVFDFATAFRHAMDLRGLILQAEALKDELAYNMELMRELTKASIDERIELANTKWQKYKIQSAEQAANMEFLVEKYTIELKERLEKVRTRMLKHALHPLTQNPGFTLVTLHKETMILREKINKLKNNQKN